MRTHLFLIPLMALLTTSCAMYKQEFDCPIPKGVPCTSETDLEAMIRETRSGPDLFLPIQKECDCSHSKKKASKQETIFTPLSRKVWICQQRSDAGYIQGHYVYQNLAPLIDDEGN